jgi:Holliday junction DNA helicase RuvA
LISALIGKVFEKEENKIHLDVNGVIYELNVSLNTLSNAKDGLYYVSEVIKESEYTLYGFLDKKEKEFFESLVKISGVGPKSAIAICSVFSIEEFSEIVKRGDIDTLKKVPGIGIKSAKRILVEFEAKESESSDKLKAKKALLALGFKKDEVNKALSGVSGSIEEMIKEGLKKLSKGAL